MRIVHPTPKVIFELRFGAPASPENVKLAASMFQDFIERSVDEEARASITMVVHNRDMKASLRSWSTSATKELREIVTLAKNPLRAIQKKPARAVIADVFADYASDLVPLHATMWTPRGGQPVATIDAMFRKMMADAATAAREDPTTLRGRATVVSVIHRAGRLDIGKALTARVAIDGRPRDVAIADDIKGAIFDFAKTDVVVRLTINATWLRNGDEFKVDPKSVRVVAVEPAPAKLASGAEFLAALHAALPSLQDEKRGREFLDETHRE